MKMAVLSRLLACSGLRRLLASSLRWSGVLVLNYHRIGSWSDSRFDRGLWSADTHAFAEQMQFCKSHLEMITPDELPHALASRRGRYGLITFDDGYRDNYEAAFPILKSVGVPATFFVTTGFIDAPRVPWWDEIAWMVRTSTRRFVELPGWLPESVLFDGSDREIAVRTLLRAYKSLSTDATAPFLDALALATGSGRCGPAAGRDLWMDWDMLREMHAAGMTIGGHTVTHPILARAGRERQREEIVGCSERLARELNGPMRYFSYPVGGRSAFDAITRDTLREVGVRYAFSYYGGFRRICDWDDYDVRRVPVETTLTPDWFRALVSMPTIFAG